MATYDQWLEAFSEVYSATPDVACPNCGRRLLRLVFTGDPDRMIGYAHFWCEHCLHGIGISRTEIPEGAVVQDIRLPRAERQPPIPDFRLVVE